MNEIDTEIKVENKFIWGKKTTDPGGECIMRSFVIFKSH
jgi:hypothetical protein